MADMTVITIFQTKQFPDLFPEIEIMGRPVDIFIPCLSYQLRIPVSAEKESRQELDIFEETVLRLIELLGGSAAVIADKICLEKDLVLFVISRLQEKGYLDDHKALTEAGYQQLQLEKTEEIEMKDAQLFYFAGAKQVLPYIHQEEKKECRSGRQSGRGLVRKAERKMNGKSGESTLEMSLGTTGKEVKVSGPCIQAEGGRSGILDSDVVREAVRSFSKRQNTLGGEPIKYRKGYAIENSPGEVVYFHLQAVLQKGDVDHILFSDGLLPDVPGIERYIKNRYPEIIESIRHQGISMSVLQEAGKEKETAEPVAQAYPEISGLYRNIRRLLGTEGVDSVDELQLRNEDKRQIVNDCFSMLEWGMFHYLRKNPPNRGLLNHMEKQSPYSNGDLVLKSMKRLRMAVNPKHEYLVRKLNRSNLNQFRRNKEPKLYTCLPLLFLEAGGNQASPVYKLKYEFPDFLGFVHRLNEASKQLRHDLESDAVKLDCRAIARQTKKTVELLLPDLDFSRAADTEEAPSMHASDEKLLGETALEKAMGKEMFESLSQDMKTQWLNISPDKTGSRMPPPHEFIATLYRILSKVLEDVNFAMPDKKVKNKQEVLEACMYRYTGRLPKSLTNVGENFYDRAVKGKVETLGAGALAYLAYVIDRNIDTGELVFFIDTIDRVTGLRGHNNVNVAAKLTEEELFRLRDDVIKLMVMIKTKKY